MLKSPPPCIAAQVAGFRYASDSLERKKERLSGDKTPPGYSSVL